MVEANVNIDYEVIKNNVRLSIIDTYSTSVTGITPDAFVKILLLSDYTREVNVMIHAISKTDNEIYINDNQIKGFRIGQKYKFPITIMFKVRRGERFIINKVSILANNGKKPNMIGNVSSDDELSEIIRPIESKSIISIPPAPTITKKSDIIVDQQEIISLKNKISDRFH